MEFHGDIFPGLHACTTGGPSLQTITEKTFADRHITAKSANIFSLESFPMQARD